MDITAFSDELQKRLSEFESSENTSDLTQTGKVLSFVRQLLHELKQFTLSYTFQDINEEIYFFKHTKPILLSQHYYYKTKFAIQVFDAFRDRKERLNNYNKTLQRLQRFASKNQSFYEYYLSEASYLDQQYFTRNNVHPGHFNRDEKFCTSYDAKLAKILAHELIKEYIFRSIQNLEDESLVMQQSPLQWTTQKVALVELIYALHAAGVFNYGRTDLKQIADVFQKIFSIDLGNYARVFSEIRIRKSGPTNFLDSLKARITDVSNTL